MSNRRHRPRVGARGAPLSLDPASSRSPARQPADRVLRGKPRPPSPRSGARTRLRRWALPGLIGAAVLVVAGIFALGGASSAPAAGVVASPRPVLGNAAAAVVIREYGDFQCPSCGAFARLVEPQIRTAYIDTGKVRLEWHDFAWIGQESRDAANAARCAGDQGRFWEFHDLLYRSQGGENSGVFSKDHLKAFGAGLGLDAAAFNACVDSGSHLDAVAADFADVSAKGFNGTPTFLIGSQRIVGAQPFAVFQAAIDAALASK